MADASEFPELHLMRARWFSSQALQSGQEALRMLRTLQQQPLSDDEADILAAQESAIAFALSLAKTVDAAIRHVEFGKGGARNEKR